MRPMIPKALRLPTDLAEEVTQRARKRGVADADYYRLLIERGLLLVKGAVPGADGGHIVVRPSVKTPLKKGA